MKVKVKLYGTLSLHVPEYKSSQGIEVEIPDGATVKDLLTHLEISEMRGAAVVANGQVLKVEDEIQNGSSLDVFQSIHGG